MSRSVDSFEEEFGELDLVDDEIDEEIRGVRTSSPSKALGGFDGSGRSRTGNSYPSDPEEDNHRSSRHIKDRHGRIVQRRPPRPSSSVNSGRKTQVQGSGSIHRRRTTRRVAAAEKHWGDNSMPSITVRDIMGSEKRATAVGMTASGHTRELGLCPTAGKDSKQGAEEKRAMIHSRWNEKRNRQSNVKNSLASFLADGQSEDDGGYLHVEPEDEELISDDDGEAHRPTSSQSLNLYHDDNSEDDKSIKSTKSHSRSSRRRRSSTKRTDGNLTDGDAGGSSHSRSRNARRRLKKPSGVAVGAGDDDDRSVGSTKSTRSRRSCRRTSRSSSGEDLGVGAQSRPNSNAGSVDGDQIRRRPESDEVQKKKTRPSSTRRKPESQLHGAPPKSRSTRRKVAAGDDDDRSVGSRKSVGGRRRRNQSHRSKKPSKEQEELLPAKHASTTRNGDGKSPPVSPLSSKPNSASSLIETHHHDEHKDKLTSLSQHIESTPKPKISGDHEERSEASSRFSGSYDQPTSILQFDPTNANHFTMVKQDKANITSEKFRHADGTESELHISALAGLPTFETVQADLNDSRTSNFSETDLRPQSTHSLGSVEYTSDYDNPRAAKSMSHIGYHHRADLASQNAGQKSEELGANQSGLRGRGVSKANSAGRRAFLNRMLKSERAEKPPRNPPNENSTFQESMKGLFGAWNKKGECEDDEEGEDQPKGNRFFRKREEIEHQALDDDGSDDN